MSERKESVWATIWVNDDERDSGMQYHLTFASLMDLRQFLRSVEQSLAREHYYLDEECGRSGEPGDQTVQQAGAADAYSPCRPPQRVAAADSHPAAPAPAASMQCGRAAAALAAARQEAKQEVVRRAYQLIGDLNDQPMVAYVVDFDEGCPAGPTADIAVRLLYSLDFGTPIENGRVIWSLRPRQVSPEQIAAGARAIDECIQALKATDEPYTLLAHLHGQVRVQAYHDGRRPLEHAMSDLGKSLATYLVEEVEGISA